MSTNTVNIVNRKASFEYAFIEKYIAGVQLTGTEIKSIKTGQASIAEAFCVFIKDELYVRNMQINEYSHGTHYNHAPKRDRKLLLTRHELKKLKGKLVDKGLTIIPLKMFIADSGYAKLEIALAKGKKLFDKREDIKKRDTEREIARKFR